MERPVLGIWSFMFAFLVSCLVILSVNHSVLQRNFPTSVLTQKPDSSNSNGTVISEATQNATKKSESEPEFVSPTAKNDSIIIEEKAKQPGREKRSSCSGRYIYVHDLPSRFNDDVIKHCESLVKWFSMCAYMVNSGLGPRVLNSIEILSEKSWFSTNQFLLEVIFRDRMKRYKCLTNDSSSASAIFVPFYAGLDVGRYLWGYNTSMRDSLGNDLAKWLAERPEWKRMWGRDHFFIAGRIAWDFQRVTDNDTDWGNKLVSLPEFMNMTMLSIEATARNNEIGIPYPTYFHPSKDDEVLEWQNGVRNRKRPYLFSFVGAPRPDMQGSIRGEIIKQCLVSPRQCKFLDCSPGSNNCDDPVKVMEVFQDSVFCLQPPGDSFTRRSIFDSILAGCIPVFFHPFSAYAQYIWHFPKNYSEYSMFISEDDIKNGKVSLKKTLSEIADKEVFVMREEVVKLIPKIIYASSGLQRLEDAFDIAVRGVLERVVRVRKDMKEGKDPGVGFRDWNWKLKLSGTGSENEWDHFLPNK